MTEETGEDAKFRGLSSKEFYEYSLTGQSASNDFLKSLVKKVEEQSTAVERMASQVQVMSANFDYLTETVKGFMEFTQKQIEFVKEQGQQKIDHGTQQTGGGSAKVTEWQRSQSNPKIYHCPENKASAEDLEKAKTARYGSNMWYSKPTEQYPIGRIFKRVA